MTDKYYQYKDTNFNIEELINNNNHTKYNELSMYLDFACHTTIHTIFPVINTYQETAHVKQLLISYLKGTENVFTREYHIRQNIDKLGVDKVKEILIANMLEKEAYNQNTKQPANINDYQSQCARYLTHIVTSNQFNDSINYVWLNQNMETFIDCYLKMKYQKGVKHRLFFNQQIEKIPYLKKGLETLNIKQDEYRPKR